VNRREFITGLGGAAAAWPLAAKAQQSARLRTIGYLGSSTALAQSPWVAAFVRRLHELGWLEGRTVAIEYRWAEGRSERFAEIAAEFVRLKVDVIVTAGTAPALAAKQATSAIPILSEGWCSVRRRRLVGQHRRRAGGEGFNPALQCRRFKPGYIRVRPAQCDLPSLQSGCNTGRIETFDSVGQRTLLEPPAQVSV
jgi:hypothetical protein